MQYFWSVNLHDGDGDTTDKCVLAHINDTTIIKFKDTNEMETFANEILRSLKEIREVYPNA